MKKDENELNENKNSEQAKTMQQRPKADGIKKQTVMQKIWNVIKKNPLSSVLLIALIACIIWANFRINSDKKQFEKDKIELTTKYELQIDSLELKNIEFSSKVFSWSVRSELLRKNVENLNQLFTVFVKESNANLIQLVNLDDNTITISTDKQYEGKSFVVPANVDLNEQRTVVSDSKTIIYTPVMGYTNKIGLLIVEISK